MHSSTTTDVGEGQNRPPLTRWVRSDPPRESTMSGTRGCRTPPKSTERRENGAPKRRERRAPRSPVLGEPRAPPNDEGPHCKKDRDLPGLECAEDVEEGHTCAQVSHRRIIP